jgi:hypothetical protein
MRELELPDLQYLEVCCRWRKGGTLQTTIGIPCVMVLPDLRRLLDDTPVSSILFRVENLHFSKFTLCDKYVGMARLTQEQLTLYCDVMIWDVQVAL